MNLPNRLTLSRIALVPVFMFFLLPFPDWVLNNHYLEFINSELIITNNLIKDYGKFIAAGFFIIAASTDGLDGYIARKRKQITRFGKFLDPIADKLLVTAALVALVQINEVTAWSATIIIGREFIVTALRLVAAAEGVVISASKLGKAKTITQMVAIIAILVNYPIVSYINFPFDKYAMTIAVLITIYSGYDYIIKNINLIDFNKN